MSRSKPRNWKETAPKALNCRLLDTVQVFINRSWFEGIVMAVSMRGVTIAGSYSGFVKWCNVKSITPRKQINPTQ